MSAEAKIIAELVKKFGYEARIIRGYRKSTLEYFLSEEEADLKKQYESNFQNKSIIN